ncbi:MAG: hypothetical protein MUF22_05775 [Chitinispirillaceae bacterium]|nr:hypothetical protein [Chitinispirillaceae bacterium]
MKKNFIIAGVLVAAAYASVYSAEQSAAAWTVNMDGSGYVTSLTLAHPESALKVEASVDIGIDYQGTPVRGTVKFANGIQRDLLYPQEVQYYWEEFKGIQALWNYNSSIGKVISFKPADAPIPMTLYGRSVRVVSKAGNEYFGKLVANANNPDWFALESEGSSISLHRLTLTDIQQVK